MTTTKANIKDRCRLCYTRLKDTSLSHHKISCTQNNHRIYNIYKRRPFRYRDLIVRYLCINLPENNFNDNYSSVICGRCATSLTKLETAYRTFDQTQKTLLSKYRKTSQIIHYQIKNYPKPEVKSEPKRLSKRKGAPKHIAQTINHHKTTAINNSQLFVNLQSTIQCDDDNEFIKNQNLLSLSNSRTNTRRKNDSLLETTNQKKKFKSTIDNCKPNNATFDITNNEPYNCINLLKPSTSTDTQINHIPPLNLTLPGTGSSISSSSSSIPSRSINSVKGNHIERIAVSLLSGTDLSSDMCNNGLNGTNDNNASDYSPPKSRTRRKPIGINANQLETTTNNLFSTPYTNTSAILSPSIGEKDEEDISTGDVTNDSSNESVNGYPQDETNSSNINKQLSSTISTIPTAEGLAITAINPTGQKQVFMAKQIGNLKKYQCSLCEKIVTNIQIHVRRHTNDKPYPCNYCEKRFTNSGDLQIHVRIHTGEKPYACPICLKSYRTIGNFNSHVKTHDSGIRPHRCEICDQIFPIPKDWYSHLRSSHRSRIPTNNLSITTTMNSSSSLNSTNATTTVTQPLFSNSLSSQQQHNETFVPNKVKLEPINRSQLIIKSSNIDDQEPVNMSKKEKSNTIDEDEENNNNTTNYEDEDGDNIEDEDEDETHHHQTTQNLLNNVSSSVHV